MSAVQNAIERVIEYHEENCNGGFNSPCNLSIDARSELAQLRADLQAAQERIVEQARQLAEARSLIDEITDDYIVSIDKDGLSHVSTNIIIDMIDWLAANPAPQE